jgi:hypothetical protein
MHRAKRGSPQLRGADPSDAKTGIGTGRSLSMARGAFDHAPAAE